MGMLIRRRIHEMQEQSRKKDIESKSQFGAVEIPEGSAVILDTHESQETKDELTYDDLSAMTVKQIRELAEKKGFTITKIIKEDVILEFLEKQ